MASLNWSHSFPGVIVATAAAAVLEESENEHTPCAIRCYVLQPTSLSWQEGGQKHGVVLGLMGLDCIPSAYVSVLTFLSPF